jgi:lysophospholipase L1-like esterase
MQESSSNVSMQKCNRSPVAGLHQPVVDEGPVLSPAIREASRQEAAMPLQARRVGNPIRRLGTRLVLLATVILVALLVLEMMTRAIYDRNGMHFGIEMWKYAKKIKRTSSNIDMGHEHTPGREAVLMGVPVQINSRGLRDREFSLSKPSGTYRILALGDSITLGWGVRQDKTFPKLLEQQLNQHPLPGGPQRYEVINAGVGNYNTAQEVAYFKERGRLYKPDMVLIAFFINDAEPTPREERNWLARESCLYVFASSFWDVVLRQLSFRPGYRDYYRSLFEEGKPGWTACQQAFRELMALCREEQIDLRIAIIPELHSLGRDYAFLDVHTAIQALARERGIPVIDLLDGLAADEPSTLWVSLGDPHPNEQAMAFFADRIYANLVVNPPRDAGEPRPALDDRSRP